MRKSTKVILWILVPYLAIGILFYSMSLNSELKTFTCKDTSTPAGNITIFNNSYYPPQENCSRRGFEIYQIGNAAAMITLWPILIFGKVGMN